MYISTATSPSYGHHYEAQAFGATPHEAEEAAEEAFLNGAVVETDCPWAICDAFGRRSVLQVSFETKQVSGPTGQPVREREVFGDLSRHAEAIEELERKQRTHDEREEALEAVEVLSLSDVEEAVGIESIFADRYWERVNGWIDDQDDLVYYSAEKRPHGDFSTRAARSKAVEAGVGRVVAHNLS